MAIFIRKTEHNELNLYLNGSLIYKRWLDAGASKVFDVMAYDKYTSNKYLRLSKREFPFLLNQAIEKYLNVGQKWWIHEAPRLIGEAEIR